MGELPRQAQSIRDSRAVREIIQQTGTRRNPRQTADYVRTILNTPFKRAVKLKRMPYNPMEGVETVNAEPKETAVFSPEEAACFLEAAAEHRLGDALRLLLSLELRKGELMGLEDIDLKEESVEIRKTLQRIKPPDENRTRLIEGSPKSRASRRKLPLFPCALEAVKRHLKRRTEEQTIAGSAWLESERLFTTSIGTALDGDNLTKTFRALCRKANVLLIRFHDLRHSCGTFLHSQKVSPFTIQQILGHKPTEHDAPLHPRQSGHPEGSPRSAK